MCLKTSFEKGEKLAESDFMMNLGLALGREGAKKKEKEKKSSIPALFRLSIQWPDGDRDNGWLQGRKIL